MRLLMVFLFAPMMLTAYGCKQKATQNLPNTIAQENVKDPYPFYIGGEGELFYLGAAIENDTLYNVYNPIFKKHGYSGNGYSWEGHIEQILEKVDNDLLHHIEFDAEAGAFFAQADSKESQQRFVNILSPIFTDLPQLEAYLKKADRARIID